MLSGLGIEFDTFSPNVDETTLPGESPARYVERITLAKMEAACAGDVSWSKYRAVLTADTAVVLGDKILGKPDSDKVSLEMITSLSGCVHEVLSCYCLRDLATGEDCVRRVSTEVIFRAVPEQELVDYVATGEGRDKAGGYAIQGRAAAFVRAIRGSYTSVVGLPLCELVEDLGRLSIPGTPG